MKPSADGSDDRTARASDSPGEELETRHQGDSDIHPENSWMREIIERHTEPFAILDPAGCVRFANPHLVQLLGGKELLGRRFVDLLAAQNRGAFEALMERWGQQEAHPPESSFVARLATSQARSRNPRVQWHPVPVRVGPDGRAALGLWGHDVEREHEYRGALEESELRQRSILRGVLTPLVIIDAYGVIQSASDSVEVTFGYSAQELVGTNVRVLMPEPHHSRHDDYLTNYRITGATNILGQNRVFEMVRKDGQRIHCELSVARIDIPGKLDPLFTGSLRDITSAIRSREALRESERRLRAIFDQEFQLVGLLDKFGRLVDVNRAALEMSGLVRKDVVGQLFEDTGWWNHSEEARALIRDAVRRASRGEFVRFETSFQPEGRGRRELDLSLKAVPGDDGEIHLLICEARDVTELKRAQAGQDGMLRALAEIGESAAMMAHEIKTPVTAVNLALRAVADKLNEKDHKILDDLALRMQRLQLMMRQTLSFAKALDPASDDCHSIALFEEAISAARVPIEEAGVDVGIDADCQVFVFKGDRALLGEVLTNLIENAVSLSAAGGRVRLTAARVGRSRCRLCVYDEGPGIAPSVQHSLFKPFVTTRAEGTGLGLPICKRIVEAHRGTIDVIDSPLGGAAFELILPLV